MAEVTLSTAEIKVMQHCLGMDNRKAYTRHGKKFYRPYRNFFAIAPGCDGYEMLVHLVACGYAKECDTNIFYLTKSGKEALGKCIGIKVQTEEK